MRRSTQGAGDARDRTGRGRRAAPAAEWLALEPAQRDAWSGLLRAQARILKRLDAELQEAHGLPLSSFDVLVQLAFAPGGRLRMSDLADAVVLSASGLTRLVDRLARQGLLVRCRGAARDTRVVQAEITEQGLDLLRQAVPTHVDGIRRLFLDRLSSEETAVIACAMQRLAGDGRRPSGPR